MADRRLFREVYPDRKLLVEEAKRKEKEYRVYREGQDYLKKIKNKKGVLHDESYDIQERFGRGENISRLIRNNLLTNGVIPASPITLLQNTNPATVCYMNSVLQSIATLPGFIGCENWPLKAINERNPFDVKEAAAIDAFQELLEAMRLPTGQARNEQLAFLSKQANFYTRIFELTRETPDEFYPLDQSDADSFRMVLFKLITKQITAPRKMKRTLDEPGGHFMLAPLYGYCKLQTEIQELRTIDTLFEVTVPPISLNEEESPGGLSQWIHDVDEPKQFHVLPDTLILKAAIFGFEGKYQGTIPIVPTFDIAAYHPAGWAPKYPGSTRYRLYGIVCHHGETIDAGHYTTLCLRNGAWQHIDDFPPSAEQVNLPPYLPFGKNSLKFANPYIFFYVREGTGPYQINEDDTFVMRPADPVVPAAAAAATGLTAEEIAEIAKTNPRFATAAARLAELKAKVPRKRNRITRKKSKH